MACIGREYKSLPEVMAALRWTDEKGQTHDPIRDLELEKIIDHIHATHEAREYFCVDDIFDQYIQYKDYEELLDDRECLFDYVKRNMFREGLISEEMSKEESSLDFMEKIHETNCFEFFLDTLNDGMDNFGIEVVQRPNAHLYLVIYVPGL